METSKSIDEIIKELEPDPEGINLTREGLGPWSMSKIKLLKQCPLSFYLKYIIKLKVGNYTPALVTTVGKAVHRILEHIIAGKKIQDSFILTKKEYADELNTEQWITHVESLEYNITEFRQKLDSFEAKFPIKRYIQELKIGVNRQYEPTGFFAKDVYFRGVVDLGMQLETNDMIILDHKTGAVATMGLRNFKTQLDIYKVLMHHGMEPVEGAQAGIHYVRDGQILLDDYVTKSVIEGQLVQELEFYIQGTIDKTKELGKFKKIRGSFCKYCDYNEMCSKGELNESAERTKKYFKEDSE